VHQAFFRMATDLIMHLEEERKLQVEHSRKVEENFRRLQHQHVGESVLNNTTEPEYMWITGFQPDISHRGLISRGGFGEVHEVFPSSFFSDLKMFDARFSQVNFQRGPFLIIGICSEGAPRSWTKRYTRRH
jgi:hypothetical protein